MAKQFLIYIENGRIQKSFAGAVYAMQYNPETGAVLNNCWVALQYDYPSEEFEYCSDSESVEFRLAYLVKKDIENGKFSNLKSINLGVCSHIVMNSGGFGSSHYQWGECEVKHD
jgi:hypothetical protein